MGLRVGDIVDVPGGMYGTVKFVGEVEGKKGMFAGVQLAAKFEDRGKNSGYVDGKRYFNTTKPGSGIFLPLEKATRKGPATPTTPSLAPFNQGGRVPAPAPALSRPNFSQSIGPGAGVRAGSPVLNPPLRRSSFQRPESPLRKTPAKAATSKLSTPGSRSSFGAGVQNKAGVGSRYGQSPMPRPAKFGASLRGPSATPSRTSLGPEPSFDDESESAATPTPARAKTADPAVKDGEIRRLRESLEQKEYQLREQAATLSDMEKSLAELQSLLPPDYESLDHKRDGGVESEDMVQMRNLVRDKNEKIQMLIAEFDAHRADFRSTIDTLEMASTETERVYEKRVDELLQEVRGLQDRGEDVENVAQQLRQLEELVQELEEGLEDARRGEAEARGEVEFLRGEVERGRSELKRERSKAAATALEDDRQSVSDLDIMRDLEAKDDEIRGLKAIIHSLSGGSPLTTGGKTNGHVNGFGHRGGDHEQTGRLEQRLRELEELLNRKSCHEEELEREVEMLRSSAAADKHNSANTIRSHRLSDRTIVPRDWRDQKGTPLFTELETMHEADSRSTVTDSSALWCEICETGGHDILTCTNMFAGEQHQHQQHQQHPQHPQHQHQHQRPEASRGRLMSTTTTTTTTTAPPPSGNGFGNETSSTPPSPHRSSQDGEDRGISLAGTNPRPAAVRTASTNTTTPHMIHDEPVSRPPPPPPPKPPNPNDLGMVAGKASGVIDGEKWCALCERDGHESVDCPFEDAF